VDAAEFLTLLSDGPLLSDGGMGTALSEGGAPVEGCLEELNVSDPARVIAVHQAFVGAGSQLLLTNSFGANRYRLDRYGLRTKVAHLCGAAVELAWEAGAELVGGSIGPLGVRLQPYGRVQPEDAVVAYQEQAGALAAAGVDLLVLETQVDLREVELAVVASREVAPDLPLVASVTFTRDDRTLLGSTPEEVASTLADMDVDVIGVNCGEGPAQAFRLIHAMRPFVSGKPLAVRPNAGGPARVGGRFVYPATPEYVGEVVAACSAEGALIVGGCCGIGPAHTRAIAERLVERATRTKVSVGAPAMTELSPNPEGAGEAVRVSTDQPTRLQLALESGRFAIAVEMEPPRSFNAATLVAAASTLRDAGATVIDVADSPMAKMRMSAWAACRLVEEQARIETVLHFPTRGRSLLRLQGDLLGAHALGIRNLFVCVGDPVTIGDYPQSLNDVDVTATGLVRLVTEAFNAGVDRAGSSIGAPTSFFPGAAVAPAADLQREVKLLAKKAAAGARFLLTQPVYSAEPITRLRIAYREVTGQDLEVPLLAGVLPLVSSRHAEFLHNEVPGIDIPRPIRERMLTAGDGESAWREGLAMTKDLLAELSDAGVGGIYVMPQFGRYDRAADVVEAAAYLSQ
jgi:homocysteine S-methyltransferase